MYEIISAALSDLDIIANERGMNTELEMVITPPGTCFHLDQICIFDPKEDLKFGFDVVEKLQALNLTNQQLALMAGICMTFRGKSLTNQHQVLTTGICLTF